MKIYKVMRYVTHNNRSKWNAETKNQNGRYQCLINYLETSIIRYSLGILHRKLEERSRSRLGWVGARFTNGSSINLCDNQNATPKLKITKDFIKAKSLKYQKNAEVLTDANLLV